MAKFYTADLTEFPWYFSIEGVSSLRIEREDENGSFQVQVTECDPYYIEYLEWIEAGNTPEPWVPPAGNGE